MDCNQNLVPLIFLHDVNGFMVGKDAEWSGIIRAGAKMVSAVSTSVVPKITVIVGGSFGAGHYAMCGKAYDPRFLFAWPTARYAVMSGASAAPRLPRCAPSKWNAAEPCFPKRREPLSTSRFGPTTMPRPIPATERRGCGLTRSSIPPGLAKFSSRRSKPAP